MKPLIAADKMDDRDKRLEWEKLEDVCSNCRICDIDLRIRAAG
jgi:hypothetical protein